MSVSLILACAGKGERAGFNQNKLTVPFSGETVLEKTFSAFFKTKLFGEIIVAVSKEDYATVKDILGDKAKTVLGGKTRTQSVINALKEVSGDIVLIHDGARPFVSNALIERLISCAKENGSAIPLVATRDTVVKADNGKVNEYIGKSGLYCVQTPQAFKTDLIKTAYQKATADFNDDGEVYKTYIAPLNYVEGDYENVKLTFKEDFIKVFSPAGVRVGNGFDCHRLVNKRKLILGGVEIPHDKGLLGHSDADVLTHAVMDAILSACAMRDIGYYFPDSDKKYKDANSILLLKEVLKMTEDAGFKVKSVAITVMAEKPKLKDYIPKIKDSLSKVLGIDISDIGLGATTLEGLGFVGREEGICVNATAVVIRK